MFSSVLISIGFCISPLQQTLQSFPRGDVERDNRQPPELFVLVITHSLSDLCCLTAVVQEPASAGNATPPTDAGLPRLERSPDPGPTAKPSVYQQRAHHG